MIIEIIDETSRELAALVAVVSLAMIGIGVHLLPKCWDRVQHYFRKISVPRRKLALPLLMYSHLPIAWLAEFAYLSARLGEYKPDIFIPVFAGTALLALLIHGCVVIKTKIKKQTVVKISKVESYAVVYYTALTYTALSIALNMAALAGVAPTMLMIDIGPFRPENFEVGKWCLYIAIFIFSVGIIMFGMTLALDKSRQRKDADQEKH